MAKAECPKCGSSSIQSMLEEQQSCCGCNRCGFSPRREAFNLCQSCGKKWTPRSGWFFSLKTLWNCHGIPERCFEINGKHMQICARCLGAFVGVYLSATLSLFNVTPPVIASVALIAVILIDWGLQNYFGILSTNRRRLVTGIMGGLGSTFMLLSGVKMGLNLF